MMISGIWYYGHRYYNHCLFFVSLNEREALYRVPLESASQFLQRSHGYGEHLLLLSRCHVSRGTGHSLLYRVSRGSNRNKILSSPSISQIFWPFQLSSL